MIGNGVTFKINITDQQKELFQQVRDIFYPEVVYLVGGAVRDMLLGVEPHDYDFCTSLEPDMIENKIKSGSYKNLSDEKKKRVIDQTKTNIIDRLLPLYGYKKPKD